MVLRGLKLYNSITVTMSPDPFKLIIRIVGPRREWPLKDMGFQINPDERPAETARRMHEYLVGPFSIRYLASGTKMELIRTVDVLRHHVNGSEPPCSWMYQQTCTFVYLLVPKT